MKKDCPKGQSFYSEKTGREALEGPLVRFLLSGTCSVFKRFWQRAGMIRLEGSDFGIVAQELEVLTAAFHFRQHGQHARLLDGRF